MKRLLDYVWSILGFLAVIFACWLLFKEIKSLSVADIWHKLQEFSCWTYGACLASTLVAYGALAWYDRIALLHLGKRISWFFIALTSFTTYALSHSVGMSMLSGGVIRYRAYSTRGLTFSQVAVLVGFSSLTFALGAVILGAGVLIIDPDLVVRVFGFSTIFVRSVGIGLLGLVFLYGMGSFLHFKPLVIGKLHIVYPRPEVVIRQFLAGPIELLGAAGIIYFALPEAVNPGYIAVLGVFIVSFSAAILSHAPGGLGVLEFVFIKAMPDVPTIDVITALIMFRFFYLLLPLIFGILVVIVFERNQLFQLCRREFQLPRWEQ